MKRSLQSLNKRKSPLAQEEEDWDLKAFAVDNICPKCGSSAVVGTLVKWEINDISAHWECKSCKFHKTHSDQDPYQDVLKMFDSYDYWDGEWKHCKR